MSGSTRLTAQLLNRWLVFVCRRPWMVLIAITALVLLAILLTTRLLGVSSEAVEMLDEELPFRQIHERFKREFPELDNTLLIVVEAPTPEQALMAGQAVQAKVQEHPQSLDRLVWPGGDPFFARNGLLLLPTEALELLATRLVQSQALLSRLAQQPNSATLLTLLAELELHADDFDMAEQQAMLQARIAETIEGALAGRDDWLSWQRLLAHEPATGPAREILVLSPRLDPERIMGGADVMQQLDQIRAELGMSHEPVRLLLTGNVALRHEELQSVIAGTRLAGLLALGLVSALMLVGLRSVSLCLIALINLAFGLSLTLGFAAVAVGRVNLISVAFVVVYIGLGVNYAIHYLLRYREAAAAHGSGPVAIIATGQFLASALVLSALTTAIGFFAFVPTAFAGVAQLGLIAGGGMLITLALSYSALPAMLAVIRPRVLNPSHQPYPPVGSLLDWPMRFRLPIALVAMGLAAAAALALPQLRFDADPLNLRDADSESVTTLRSLLDDGSSPFYNIQVLAEPGQDLVALQRQLDALDSVRQSLSFDDFIPADLADRHARLDDLFWLLGPELIEADWRILDQNPVELNQAVTRLLELLHEQTRLHHALTQLKAQLDGTDGQAVASRVNHALLDGLGVTMRRLTRSLQPDAHLAAEDFPDWFRAQWLGRHGARLIQVFPALDMRLADDQRRFSDEVRAVAGDAATGGTIIQQAAAAAVTTAFRQALSYALVGIVLLLLLVLGSIVETLKVLTPLIFGGLLTAAAMVLLNLPFNFANVIALPLLLGVAVDNGVHLVYRHRAGRLPHDNVLRTSTARAIVFGALITAGGFGNLAFSPHAGTAGMGLILAVGLGLMVLATLVLLPALLDRQRRVILPP